MSSQTGSGLPSLRSAVWWSVLTLLLFLVADAAIFRSGWYLNYLEPDSSSGSVEYPLYWLRHTHSTSHPEVMVVGDSRIAEGFSSPEAATAVGNRLNFWNAGIPGTSPRDWYYFLRDADPSHRRFAAIALALDRYSDEDVGYIFADRIGDLNFSIGRLRVTDCFDFARSMKSDDNRRRALTECLFRGIALRRDLQSLLSGVQQRLRSAREARNHGLEDLNRYSGNPADLRGLSADLEKGVIHFPPGLNQAQIGTIEATVTPSFLPDAGETTSYRALWLGRILDLYRDSPTKIVFFETPRAPLPVPEEKVPPRFLQSIAGRRQVTILPALTFRDFERPELFGDGLHLNGRGRLPFSRRLGENISSILGSR